MASNGSADWSEDKLLFWDEDRLVLDNDDDEEEEDEREASFLLLLELLVGLMVLPLLKVVALLELVVNFFCASARIKAAGSLEVTYKRIKYFGLGD